jgi:hypothetical protein
MSKSLKFVYIQTEYSIQLFSNFRNILSNMRQIRYILIKKLNKHIVHTYFHSHQKDEKNMKTKKLRKKIFSTEKHVRM